MTFGDRIKKIRKEKDLTQAELGKIIGIKPNSISLIESGSRNASEQVILSICRSLNINEDWLRTGKGDMFVQLPQNEVLASQIRDFLSGANDGFRERLISMLIRLKPEQWEVLERYAKDLVGFSESDTMDIPTVSPGSPEPDVDEDAAIKAEAREKAEAYYNQLLLEASSGMSVGSTPANTG